MFLYINNSIREKLQIGLVDEKKYIFKKQVNIKFSKSEKLLFLINKFLKDNQIVIHQIKGLIIYPGPGSFTSLRISALFANTWAYVNKIPIYKFIANEYFDLKQILSRPASQFLLPAYGAEPNISQPKK